MLYLQYIDLQYIAKHKYNDFLVKNRVKTYVFKGINAFFVRGYL